MAISCGGIALRICVRDLVIQGEDVIHSEDGLSSSIHPKLRFTGSFAGILGWPARVLLAREMVHMADPVLHRIGPL